jgi:hypothetical protein
MWKRDTSPQPVVDTSPQPAVDKPSPTPARTGPPGPTRIENRHAENVVINFYKSVVMKGEVSGSEDL